MSDIIYITLLYGNVSATMWGIMVPSPSFTVEEIEAQKVWVACTSHVTKNDGARILTLSVRLKIVLFFLPTILENRVLWCSVESMRAWCLSWSNWENDPTLRIKGGETKQSKTRNKTKKNKTPKDSHKHTHTNSPIYFLLYLSLCWAVLESMKQHSDR